MKFLLLFTMHSARGRLKGSELNSSENGDLLIMSGVLWRWMVGNDGLEPPTFTV